MCVSRFGFWLRPANPGWDLWCVCLGLGFACTPPTPGIRGWGLWSVCSGTGFGCTPPFVAGVFGAGLDFGFTPPILAEVLGCVGLSALSAWTLPVLAGVCGVGVRAAVGDSPVPRCSWPRCRRCVWLCVRPTPTPPFLAPVCGALVWVLVMGLTLPTPGWGVGMCLFVCAPRLHPANSCWGVR